ncbi:magnesium chelatase [Ectothiorhodospira shaposhnikovii]|uniref:vWA domain-containing protein n=1 Tax=Ectothiorhodospira shaposhnikovii TaxID=1054 RepID=UPI00190861E9|nr:VWA domain-containing protein [Ectothiorhodospira shaposhnikovii]MBK1674799.1 magnesium chelatase [Ectothiorhodospira shaposhnikovii]
MPDGRGDNPGRQRESSRLGPGAIHWHRSLIHKGHGPLTRDALVYRHRRGHGDMLYCLVLDCSGSMLRRDKLALAKGLLSTWVQQIYVLRGELAVIGFSGSGARVLQPPARAAVFNEDWIAPIGGGGGTPMASGVALADALLLQVRRRNPGKRIGLWLLTDGRTHRIPPKPVHADFCQVVDFETEAVPLGRAARIARAWGCAHGYAGDDPIDGFHLSL